MTSLVPENVKKLLITYRFEVDPNSVIEDLKCTICKNLLNDAYQTLCDCKYCCQCIVSYINDGNEYCPGGKEECLEEQLVIGCTVFSNSVLNKKVIKVRVRCPNESCKFTSTLAQIEDHLRLCSHQPMECPYIKIGCANAKVNRDLVETHLSRDMLVHSQLLMEVVDNLKNEVGGLKEELRVNKLEIASFKEESKLKEIEIWEERRIVQEERVALTAVVEELKEEVAALRRQLECAENQQSLTQLIEDVKELRKEIEIKLEESRKMVDEVESPKKGIEEYEDNIVDIKVEADALKMGVGSEREESKKMRGEIEVLQGDLKRIGSTGVRLKKDNDKVKNNEEEAPGIIDGRVDKLTEVADSLGLRINKEVVVGSLWFKVSRFDALRKKRGSIFSSHLYSHINGYKLQILIGTTTGGWLCVSSIICKGEYDDVLSWPSKGLSVSVSLIDHSTKKAYKTVTIKYDDRCCNKPIDKDNKSYGSTRLAYLTQLDSITGLIVSDSVILLVTARPP